MESIMVALIGGAVTLAGVVASNSRSRAVLEQKVDELSRRVEKHNCLGDTSGTWGAFGRHRMRLYLTLLFFGRA